MAPVYRQRNRVCEFQRYHGELLCSFLYNGISWERTQLSNNREYDPGIAFQISKGSFEWFKVWNQRVETVAEAIYEGT